MSHFRRFKREYPYAGTQEARQLGMRMMWGGDDPQPVNNYYAPPAAPAAPSASQSAADYAASMPQMYETQLQYQPKFAAMSKAIGEQLYPETSKIQENLAPQALAQANSQKPPDWMMDEYKSNMRAQLGENVSSPIGADQFSRGMLGFNEDWKNQGWNKAMSLAGRQQLTQAPTMAETVGGYTPAAVMGYNAQNFGTTMSGYNAGLGYSASLNNSANQLAGSNYNAQMGLYSSLGSAALGAASDPLSMMMYRSSERYKKNVQIWA